MSGFSGILVFKKDLEKKLGEFIFPGVIQNHYSKKAQVSNSEFAVHWYNNSKFEKDGFLIFKNKHVFGFDGIRLDSGKPINSESGDTFLTSVLASKGTFSAVYLNGLSNELVLFADQTASRQVFYYRNSAFVAFSSSIFQLISIIKHFNISISLCEPASYMMLSLGYMLEDYTLISEIKKVKAGTFVTLNAKGQSDNMHHQYYREVKYERLTNDLINELDNRFKKSIELEYQKDREYGFENLSTLSGGLDSRLNVMLAHEYGFKDITVLTFSEGFKSDELTARRISADLNLKHLVLLLNGGFQLYDMTNPLMLNNCSVYYFGAAQTLAAVKRINFTNYGLFHNGGLAESSKGGYLDGLEYHKPTLQKRYAVSQKLFDQIGNELIRDILSRYPNDEMFATYNRGFNAIHNGSWMTMPFTQSVSTYMDLDFADIAYAIHPKLRFGGYLTVEWIKKLHPNLCKYPWQLGLKPTNNKALQLAARVKYKIKRTITGRNDSPVPFSEWYNSSPNLRSFVNTQFRESPSWEMLQKDMITDIQDLFVTGTVTEKLLCISYLKSVEMLFLKDTLSEQKH
jgi:asparagine synthase (glutamine-hydrolysing)